MKPTRSTFWLNRLLILSVILLAFGLRLHYLSLFDFHIDEYFTLAAANFIAERGTPTYPTGLFYDPGLPYSYLTGGLFRWFGFSEAMGRWPAVWFGTLAVVTVYWLGKRVFGSRWVGLLAALLLAINLDSVAWGGRARMITLAQWLALLSVGLLWVGLQQNSVRHRLLFALTSGLTLLTHFSTVVLLPAWYGATAILIGFRQMPFKPMLIRDGLIALIVAGLALSSGVIFQPPPTVEFQTSQAGLDEKVGLLSNKFLQFPPNLGQAWESYGAYYLDQPHLMVTILAIVGMVVAGVGVLNTKARRHEGTKGKQRGELGFASKQGALYLGLIFVIAMAVLALIINPHWQRSRYLLMQVLGVYYLLAAYGLFSLAAWLASMIKTLSLTTRRTTLKMGLGLLGSIILVVPFWNPLQSAFAVGYLGWNRYDLAAKHIAENKAPNDKVMTMHPPANWLYVEQSDYYLVQSSPKLIQRPDGQLGDRYTGATWLKDADDLQPVLAAPERTWLMAQEFWLFNSYDSYLQQQILQRMDKQWGEGGVWALTSRPGTWPLARDITTPVEGQFENGVRLVGFDAQPPTLVPGGVIWLTLFWQGEQLPNDLKVFVHLRDEANHTVAQADHLIYDAKVPSSRWDDLFGNDPARQVRDGATLFLPSDLATGTYRLMVGFYHPETFARVGVVNDVSGEAGVIVAEYQLP